MTHFDWAFVLANLPRLLGAVLIDLAAAVVGFTIGSCLGLALALMRLAPLTPLRWPAIAYTVFVSSIPHYVLLLWIYFGIATAFGIAFSPLQAIGISVSLIAAAYTSEVFRAGILAIDRGQFEAAKSIGMGPGRTLSDVIVPQLLRTTLPALGNVFIMVFKGAAIMSVIAAPDIVFVAQDLSLRFFRPFETYTAVALILAGVALLCSALLSLGESRLRLPR